MSKDTVELVLPDQLPAGVVGIVATRFNRDIVDTLHQNFMSAFNDLTLRHSIKAKTIYVPGALEIPHGLRKLSKTKPKPKVLVALGCVIKGETYHFEVVSNTSANAVMKVNEDTNIPVINGIITCYTKEQAISRANDLGMSLAKSALYMITL